MRIARVLPVFAFLVASACNSATEPRPSALLGRWTRSEAVQSRGRYETRLTFAAGGRFESDFRAYGVYGGEAAHDVSGYTRYVGRYSIRGDSVAFSPDTLFVWDRFYGATSPITVQTTDLGRIYDDARYVVRGDALVLDYVTYPADGGVATRQTFSREP